MIKLTNLPCVFPTRVLTGAVFLINCAGWEPLWYPCEYEQSPQFRDLFGNGESSDQRMANHL